MSDLPDWANEGRNFHSLTDAKRAARFAAIRGGTRVAVDRFPVDNGEAFCVTTPHDSPIWERVFVMRPGLCDLSPYNFSPTEYNGNSGNAIRYAEGIAVVESH